MRGKGGMGVLETIAKMNERLAQIDSRLGEIEVATRENTAKVSSMTSWERREARAAKAINDARGLLMNGNVNEALDVLTDALRLWPVIG